MGWQAEEELKKKTDELQRESNALVAAAEEVRRLQGELAQQESQLERSVLTLYKRCRGPCLGSRISVGAVSDSDAAQ